MRGHLAFLGLVALQIWNLVRRSEFLEIMVALDEVEGGDEHVAELCPQGQGERRLAQERLTLGVCIHTSSIASCNCVRRSAILGGTFQVLCFTELVLTESSSWGVRDCAMMSQLGEASRLLDMSACEGKRDKIRN